MMKSMLSIYLVLLICSFSCLAQIPEPKQAELDEAFSLFLNGRPGEAIERFEVIAEQNPSSETGLAALRFLATHTDEAKSREYYSQIVQEYPATVDETRARLGLIGWNFENDYDKAAYIAACNGLLSAMEAPTLDEITAASGHVTQQILALDSIQREQALEVYTAMQVMVASEFPDLISGDTADSETSMQILRFLRLAFGPLDIGYDGMLAMMKELDVEKFNTIPQRSHIDPSIVFLSPSPGAVTAPRPIIDAKITVGDLSRYQVDLFALQATLDGVDIKNSLSLSTSYSPGELNTIYETIDVRFEPRDPLSPGQHRLELDVPTQGYPGDGPGRTVAELEFVVQEVSQKVTISVGKDSTIRAQKQPL